MRSPAASALLDGNEDQGGGCDLDEGRLRRCSGDGSGHDGHESHDGYDDDAGHDGHECDGQGGGCGLDEGRHRRSSGGTADEEDRQGGGYDLDEGRHDCGNIQQQQQPPLLQQPLQQQHQGSGAGEMEVNAPLDVADRLVVDEGKRLTKELEVLSRQLALPPRARAVLHRIVEIRSECDEVSSAALQELQVSR